jgi:hypothetical protein
VRFLASEAMTISEQNVDRALNNRAAEAQAVAADRADPGQVADDDDNDSARNTVQHK